MEFEIGLLFVRYFNFMRHFEDNLQSFSPTQNNDSLKYWSMLALRDFDMIQPEDLERYPLINNSMLTDRKMMDIINNRNLYFQNCRTITRNNIRNILISNLELSFGEMEAFHSYQSNQTTINISFSYNLETDVLTVNSINQIIPIFNENVERSSFEEFTLFSPMFLGEL
ncbi:MAG: hypothetical protein KBF35_03065 [Saprospiraceae bacterium]|nr:hypothetical protein [Saprospiraceae bacterium]